MIQPVYDFGIPDAYLKALLFAADAHAGQLITGSRMPYLTHLTAVCMEATTAIREMEHGDLLLTMQCALLHDVLEDTPIIYEELEAAFSQEIARGVLALTKDESLPREAQMADSLQRILLLEVPEIRVVKMADRVINLQPPPASWNAEKCSHYRSEAQFILDQLSGVNHWIEARLAAKIEAYKVYC